MAPKPGIIPLRPLSLSDIFNGAVGYIRTNPKASLGLTAVVVVITQILALVMQVGPVIAIGGSLSATGEEASTPLAVGSVLSSLTSGVATFLGGLLLSGMLTVVVGRAVFGSKITIGEAWQRVRGRLLALVGYTLLMILAALLFLGMVVGIIAGIAAAANATAAVIIGIPLGLATIAVLIYVGNNLAFAPVAIVLERKPIVESIRRSFGLVRNRFWRVFGIRLLASLVASVVAGAVSVPFSLGAGLTQVGEPTTGAIILMYTAIAIGSAIGQIITAPFTAGVDVLLYTDARIRAEAFDLVLRTGANAGPADIVTSDNLWLTPPR